MPHLTDIIQVVAVILGIVVMVVVLRTRHRSKANHDLEYAHENICEHLKPALTHLEASGHQIARVGQIAPEMPLEIHIHPGFDPNAVYEELKLEPPVYVSERGVLYCKEDWCELHPMK
jgi:hypothetical protein